MVPAPPPHAIRVVVTGSESTGKTTLAAALAAAFGTLWVPEYARVHAEQVQRPLTAADVERIARGHLAAEDAASTEWLARFGAHRGALAPPLVLDTDLVSTTVYARHYYGACPPWIETAARQRLGDLYLLCAPDLPWRADGVRDQPAARAVIHRRFADRLEAEGAEVAHVHGVGTARTERARRALERMLRARHRIA